MERKITVTGVITEGVGIALKNVISLILACLLWIVTIWIPYINVGTTIAIQTIPLELSRGKIINPLFIFDPIYRKNMGEFFILLGLKGMGVGTAALFFFFPALVLNVAWGLAVLIFLDKGVTPLDAIAQSNKATYGYKWTIFGVGFAVWILGVILGLILMAIMAVIPFIGIILYIAAIALFFTLQLSCSAVIYRQLTAPAAPAPAPTIEAAPAE